MLLKGQIFKCLWKLNSAKLLETGGLQLGKFTWPSVLLSCRVTGEVDVLLHGIADK